MEYDDLNKKDKEEVEKFKKYLSDEMSDEEKWRYEGWTLDEMIKIATGKDKELLELESHLGSFVEYFMAIDRGEIGEKRPSLRTFERILMDRSKKLLGWK